MATGKRTFRAAATPMSAQALGDTAESVSSDINNETDGKTEEKAPVKVTKLYVTLFDKDEFSMRIYKGDEESSKNNSVKAKTILSTAKIITSYLILPRFVRDFMGKHPRF
jgi:hypothetical protein